MGGSFGGMMMRHADRMHGSFSSTNDPDYTAPPRRKPHPDVTAANAELSRIQSAYRKARTAAVLEFRNGYLLIEDDLIRTKIINGHESISELCRIGHEL